MYSLATAISFLSITAAASLLVVWAIERRKAKNYCEHGRRLGQYCEPCAIEMLKVFAAQPKRVVWELEDL